MINNIHYVVLTHNEPEVSNLFETFIQNADYISHVHVLDDNSTQEHREVIQEYLKKLQAREITTNLKTHSLNGNFAEHRNAIHDSVPEYNWIVMFDADENIDSRFFSKIQTLLNIIEPQNIELVYLPRNNTVEGITPDYIESQGWVMSEGGLINYPDFQGRLYLKRKGIRWEGKVHEKIRGANFSTTLKYDWAHIQHSKSFEKQQQQNNFYASL